MLCCCPVVSEATTQTKFNNILLTCILISISGMRKPYKGERDIFDLKDLTSKEPFGNFDQWFKIACETPGILEANAMTLATATKLVPACSSKSLNSPFACWS